MAHAIHQQTTTPPSAGLTQPTATRGGDHERLFRLLETDGPAPKEFMLFLNDPVIERENIFEDFEDEDHS